MHVTISVFQGVGKGRRPGVINCRRKGDCGSRQRNRAIGGPLHAVDTQAVIAGWIEVTHVVGQQGAGGNDKRRGGKCRIFAGNQRIRSSAELIHIDRNRCRGRLPNGVIDIPHGIGERGIAVNAGGRGEGDGLSRGIPHGRAIGDRSYSGDGECRIAGVVTEELGRRENGGANITGDVFQHGKRIRVSDSRYIRGLGKFQGHDKRRQGAVQITPPLPVAQGDGEGINALRPVMHVGKTVIVNIAQGKGGALAERHYSI